MSDPGSALSGRFHFSTATVCLAPMASLKAINPGTHSVGLTKNVKVDANPSHVDLTQGMRQDVVSTVTNKMSVTASFEVYELTAKNLAYGLGLDGSGYNTAPDAVALASVAPAAGSNSVTVTGDQTSIFSTGTYGYIQQNLDDQVFIFKVASSSTSGGNTTIQFASGYTVPTGMTFTLGARAGVINKIDANPAAANAYFSAKVIGTSVKDRAPLVLVFPKVRITKGFGVAFSDSAYGNLPFELTPMVPLPSDTGYDADFSQLMHVMTV